MENSILKKAKLQHQAGELDEAKQLYQSHIKNNPNDADALQMLGILAAQEKDFNTAESYFNEAISINPDNALLHVHLANVKKSLGNNNEALNVLEHALVLDPQCALAMNNIGTIYHSQGKLDQAATAYREAIHRQRDYIDAHYNLANILIKQGYIEQALDQLATILEYYPHHFPANFQTACLQMRRKRFDIALTHLHKIIDEFPLHFETMVNIATCYLQEGDLETAKKYYTNANKIAPDDFQTLFNLGLIYTILYDLDHSIKYYQLAIQLKPDDFNARNNLGVAFLQKGHLIFAQQQFEEALRIQPNNKAIQYTVDSLKQNKQVHSAPPDYIANLFDHYAGHYDQHLLTSLEYKTPEFLHDAVLQTFPKLKQINILDLGCGTGLCGPSFKPLAKRMDGVDLSENMLAIAKEKKIYDNLSKQDITEFLQQSSDKYDLIIAADVLVYLGDLENLMQACMSCLAPGGAFTFNTEISESDDYVINQSGRFAHSYQYLESLALENNYQIAYLASSPSRLQREDYVMNHICVFVRH